MLVIILYYVFKSKLDDVVSVVCLGSSACVVEVGSYPQVCADIRSRVP